MATTTMTEVISPDVSITKTERYNASRLAQLLNNPSVSCEDKSILRAIKSGTHNLCYFNTTYKLGKNVKQEHLGRYYPIKGGGQSLSVDVRSALFGEFYHDVDMINAQPTILVKQCEIQGWKCDALADYVLNREARIKEAHAAVGGDRASVKQKIIQILFGGSGDGLPEFFSATLYNELRIIRQNIWNANKDKFKTLVKKPNFAGSAMAHILQTEERQCLQAMDAAFAKRGYSMDVLIHDGGLVAKKDDGVISESLLRAIEEDIKKATGYSLHLAIKPMNTTIQFKDENDEYSAWKTEFEKSHFRLQIPQCFVWLHPEGHEMLSFTQLQHLEGQTKMADGKTSFLSRWMADENMLTYNRLVFCPKKETPPNCFNIFDGFANIPAKGDFSAFIELVGLVSNHDPLVEAYLHNLFAHMVQKPYEKSGVCVCYIGDQGVGKSLLNQKVGKIFGSNYYYETTSPQNNVFHNFNSGTERTIMLFMDEAGFDTNKSFQSKLKTIITSDKETYTKKGHESVVLDDYRNVFMATNHSLPFIAEGTDRRFVAIQCSSERMGQHEFWKQLVQQLDQQVSAYHQHLLTRDISAFNPSRDRPITEIYRDIKQLTSIPYHAGFFQKTATTLLTRAELFADGEVVPKSWKASDLYEEMGEYLGEKFKISSTRLGIDLRKIYCSTETGGITKHTNMLFSTYELDPKKCMEFLKSKDWWVD